MFGIFSSQECTLRLLVLNLEFVRQKVAHCRRKLLLLRWQRISLQTPTTKSTTKNEACEIFLVIEFHDAIWRCSMFYLFFLFILIACRSACWSSIQRRIFVLKIQRKCLAKRLASVNRALRRKEVPHIWVSQCWGGNIVVFSQPRATRSSSLCAISVTSIPPGTVRSGRYARCWLPRCDSSVSRRRVSDSRDLWWSYCDDVPEVPGGQDSCPLSFILQLR